LRSPNTLGEWHKTHPLTDAELHARRTCSFLGRPAYDFPALRMGENVVVLPPMPVQISEYLKNPVVGA
jgi:hypothetical protein